MEKEFGLVVGCGEQAFASFGFVPFKHGIGQAGGLLFPAGLSGDLVEGEQAVEETCVIIEASGQAGLRAFLGCGVVDAVEPACGGEQVIHDRIGGIGCELDPCGVVLLLAGSSEAGDGQAVPACQQFGVAFGFVAPFTGLGKFGGLCQFCEG